MEPIGIAKAAPPSPPVGRKPGEAASSAGASSAQALVAVDPMASSEAMHYTARRPLPAFLAHLVAARQRAPQTRVGRRAEPAEAAAVYTAALILPPDAGLTLRRSI